MSQQTNIDGLQGQQDTSAGASEFNAQAFLVWSILSRISTATPVRVMAVTNDGGLSSVGFVDVLPLVNQLDGAGNAVPHATIFTCPYARIQGGTDAIILDPKVGDIGMAIFADRDITSVIANKGQANPGSGRRFDMSDAVYIGGILNGTPVQYVQFNADGLHLVSPAKVTIDAPEIDITGHLIVVGNVDTTGTLTNNTKDVGSTHKHSGVSAGGANTGDPI